MSELLKLRVPMTIGAIIGVVMIIAYFFVAPPIISLSVDFMDWVIIVAGVMVGIGVINLTLIHGKRVMQKRERWPLSAWLLFFMYFSMIVGLVLGEDSTAYQFLFMNVLAPVAPTMWSLLAFFITTAAFRACRARDLTSVLFLISFVFVALKNAPIGGVIWEGFEVGAHWLEDIPNTAGMRGITIAGGLGALLLGLRVFLGYEKGAYGEISRETREG